MLLVGHVNAQSIASAKYHSDNSVREKLLKPPLPQVLSRPLREKPLEASNPRL